MALERKVDLATFGRLAEEDETIDRELDDRMLKMARAKESLAKFLSLMEGGDRASLLAFDETVTELAPLTGIPNRCGELLAKMET
mgnify:CR=1 FL=1